MEGLIFDESQSKKMMMNINKKEMTAVLKVGWEEKGDGRDDMRTSLRPPEYGDVVMNSSSTTKLI